MEKKPFFISAVAWHEVGAKKLISLVNLFSNTLESSFDLNEYGEDLNEIAVIFIILPYETRLHPERMRYRTIKKEVIAEKKVPYDLIEKGGSDDILAVFANTFLSIVQDFSKYKIKDFDSRRFHADAQQLFEKKGWLVPQEA